MICSSMSCASRVARTTASFWLVFREEAAAASPGVGVGWGVGLPPGVGVAVPTGGAPGVELLDEGGGGAGQGNPPRPRRRGQGVLTYLSQVGSFALGAGVVVMVGVVYAVGSGGAGGRPALNRPTR